MCTEGKCCWIELKKALFIYSIIEIVLCIIGVIGAFVFMAINKEDEDMDEMKEMKEMEWPLGPKILLGLNILTLIFAILLLIGASKEKVSFVKYFYYFGWVEVLVYIILIIVTLALGKWITTGQFIACSIWRLVWLIFLVRRVLKIM